MLTSDFNVILHTYLEEGDISRPSSGSVGKRKGLPGSLDLQFPALFIPYLLPNLPIIEQHWNEGVAEAEADDADADVDSNRTTSSRIRRSEKNCTIEFEHLDVRALTH